MKLKTLMKAYGKSFKYLNYMCCIYSVELRAKPKIKQQSVITLDFPSNVCRYLPYVVGETNSVLFVVLA